MTWIAGLTTRVLLVSDGVDGSSGNSKAAPKKSGPVTRLGRGLGALIPAAAPRGPSQGTANPQTVTAEPKVPTPASPPSMQPTNLISKSPDRGTGEVVPSEADSLAVEGSKLGTTPDARAASSPALPRSAPAGRSVGSSPDTGHEAGSTWNMSGDHVIQNIPIARIQRNPRQPRERFDDAALRALADSIRQDGLLQPIVVRASRTITGPIGAQMYELIAGERRLRAFTLLGRSSIPALIHRVDDRTSAVLALIENVQREDLNPMERAHGLQKLMHEFSFSQQDLASRVGLDRSTVANLLRLNDLDTHTAAALREGAITTGHAKALLSLSDFGLRKTLVAKTIAEGLSVRELERAVRQSNSSMSPVTASGRLPPSGKVISAQVADLERRIGTHLGTEVHLKTGRRAGSGAITITFSSHVQFEALMDRIGFDLEGSDRPGGR